jgi:hypothetical protein
MMLPSPSGVADMFYAVCFILLFIFIGCALWGII